MCSQFDCFAIEGSVKSQRQRRVVVMKQEGAFKILVKRTNRDALLSRPHTTLEYTTPYFGTGAGRFIYFVCMCCAVQLGYRAMKGKRTGRGCKRGWRRMILERNGVDERAFRVWSLDSLLHDAFKLYFSPR